MAQTIKLKRSATAGAIPSTSDLALGEIAINTADGAVYIKKGNNDIVAVHDNDILHIDTTNSRVGIGKTNPNYELDVNGGVNIASGNVLRWGSGDVEIINSSYNLLFKTYDGSSSLVEHMRITSAGDVGIGTGAPGYKLEIAEDTDTTADLLMLRNSDTTYAQTWAFQSDTSKDLVITGSSGSGGISLVPGSRGLMVTGNVSTTGGVTVGDYIIHNGDSNAKFGFSADDTIVFRTGGNERVRFTPSGTVGIGETVPDGELHVKGIGGGNGDIYLERTSGGVIHLQAQSAAGVIGTFSNHPLKLKANDTVRLEVATSGAITFNSAYTFPTSDGSANQVLTTDGLGSLTFADVSGSSGVTVSNNANNRVLTGDGTNANAEANLTFDGSTLVLTGDMTVTDSTNDPFIRFQTSEQEYVVRIDNSDSDKFQIRDVTNSATRLSIDTSGNITVSGTVDGRDIATDGSKLDGIEANATADQTASEILTAIKTVDGSGSGLDADTLDGYQSGQFLRSDAADSASGTLTFSGVQKYLGATHWVVSASDAALQRADARDDDTDKARLHWYGTNASGSNTNFRHAWYDGSAYVNVDVASQVVSFSGGLSATSLNTGQGAYELYAMNQNVRTTDAVTFATVNTGQGATEVHLMNQNVRTTDSPSFNALTIDSTSSTHNLYLDNRDDFLNTTNDAAIWITSGASGGFKSAEGAHLVFEGRQTTRNFYFKVGNVTAPQHIMHNNGKVGIGTGDITPSSTLQVSGSIQGTSFSDGTISGITFIDEDSFSTNSATRVPTQQSIKAYVDAQVAGVVDSAPSALNTLNELAAALGDDASFSTTTSTALGNRLRVDTASQGLTGTQQANAITNLGITATKAELNLLDGVTATTTELNYTDGVTSNIQTQLNSKLNLSGGTMTGNINLNGSNLTGINYLQFENEELTTMSAAYQMVVDANDSDSNIPAHGDYAGSVPFGIYFTGDNGSATTTLGSGLVKVWHTGHFKSAHIDYFVGLYNTGVTTTEFDYLDGVTSNIQTQLNGKLSTSGTASQANNLNATDDRDIAPEDLSYTDDFRIYFADKGGLETGTIGSNYQDVLVLNSYSDATGGDANALAFDKSEKKIYHYQADQAATNWGTAKTLAYTDDITLSTLSITATATELNYTDGVTSNIQTQLNARTTVTTSGYNGTYNIPIHYNGVLYTTPTAGAVQITGSSGQITTPSHGNSSQWNSAYTLTNAITATAAEINKLDGVTATTTELNYVDGVTSNIQTQLDGKQASGSYLTLSGTQTVTGAKTFTGGIASDTFTGSAQPGSYIDFDDDGSGNGSNCVTVNSLAGLNLYWDSNDNDGSSFKLFHATSEVLAVDPSGNLTLSGTVDGVDIASRDSVLTSTTTTANAALPKAGGTMTGDIILSGVSIKLPNSSSEGIHTSTDHRVIDSLDSTLRIGDTGKHNIIRLHGQGSDDFRVYYGATDYQIFHAGNPTQITQVGTITSGTWNGGVIASAYLDSDTAHLSGTQTFSGAKTFSNNVTIGNATYGSYGSGSTDITGLINGSTFGSFVQGTGSGHHVIGIRDNDNADSFAIISGSGNYDTDTTYDKLVFRAQADGTVTVGGGNLGVTGNITLTGTVDGRDVATDGTKLDTIATNADVTPSWVPSSDPSYLTSSSTQSKYLRSDANDDFSGTLNYTPSTGTILSVGGQAILQRMTANGAITIGHDDAVIIAAGDTSGVMNTNISNATETVFFGAEGGFIAYAFPNNDITWSNRKSFSFDGANGLNMNSVFTVDINGNLSATTKSFDIEHPSKEGMRLRYGSLEGPENGVYVRGKSKEKVISLPDYWPDLIHEDSITVQLTAIGGGQELYVEKIEDNKVYVNGDNYFYYIQAERKDVERFEVEYEV